MVPPQLLNKEFYYKEIKKHKSNEIIDIPPVREVDLSKCPFCGRGKGHATIDTLTGLISCKGCGVVNIRYKEG